MLEVEEAGLFGVWDGFGVEGGLLGVCSGKSSMLVSICLSTLFVLRSIRTLLAVSVVLEIGIELL